MLKKLFKSKKNETQTAPLTGTPINFHQPARQEPPRITDEEIMNEFNLTSDELAEACKKLLTNDLIHQYSKDLTEIYYSLENLQTDLQEKINNNPSLKRLEIKSGNIEYVLECILKLKNEFVIDHAQLINQDLREAIQKSDSYSPVTTFNSAESPIDNASPFYNLMDLVEQLKSISSKFIQEPGIRRIPSGTALLIDGYKNKI